MKWPAHEYIIKDLDGDETYRVQVLSKSLSGKTAQSEWIATEVLRSGTAVLGANCASFEVRSILSCLFVYLPRAWQFFGMALSTSPSGHVAVTL